MLTPSPCCRPEASQASLACAITRDELDALRLRLTALARDLSGQRTVDARALASRLVALANGSAL